MKLNIKKILLDDNFLSMLGQATFAALSYISFSTLARSFSAEYFGENGKAYFGEWMLFLTSISTIEMIRFGLTRTALVRFLSGAKTKEEFDEIVGSGWVINFIITAVLIVIVTASFFIFNTAISESGYYLFFLWYPFYSIIVLPFNNGISILQAKQKFGKMIILRLVSMGTFVVFLIVNHFFYRMMLDKIVLAYALTSGLASIYALIMKWSGLNVIGKAKKDTVKKLFNFGKFSLGSILGSNLLKSSDTYIISFMMTNAHVAIYSIPLKLIEIIEIPLRSLVSVALPRMAKASRENDNDKVKSIFYSYTGISTLLIFPVLILLFFLAKPLIWLVGGDEYVVTDLPATIFRIFLIYGAFLSVDRFAGVALDSINRPKFNFVKVILMAIANIAGDIVAIYFFDSLESVAIVTIVNVLTGVYVGNLYLRKEINIKVFKSLKIGFQDIKEQVNRFLNN